MIIGKEYIIGKTPNYQYGMFHQEKKSKYYISDKTIDLVVAEIDWNTNEIEKEYIKSWRTFEEIHKKYCLNEILEQEYNQLIENEFNNYEKITGYDFGECVDELINHILIHLS